MRSGATRLSSSHSSGVSSCNTHSNVWISQWNST
jgi:hypothetical protein